MDVMKLLLTIAAPILLVFGVVTYKLGRGISVGERLAAVFALDTSHGLIKQGLLWLAIGIPLCMGLAVGWWVWIGCSVDLSPNGFKRFLEISILPLAIMSISLPLAGLVSSLHSTQQAAKQISLSTFKNNIDAFYAHRKAMGEYFKDLDDMTYFDQYVFKYKAHPVLHKRFFKGAPEKGWPSMRSSQFESIEERILSAAERLLPVLDGDPRFALDSYLNASADIFLAAEMLHIKEITGVLVRRGVYVKYPGTDGGSTTLGVTTLETLAALRFVREFYNNFCDFSGRRRLKIPEKLGDVFGKTKFWLDKGYFIEGLHFDQLKEMVRRGDAIYGELHSEKTVLGDGLAVTNAGS